MTLREPQTLIEIPSASPAFTVLPVFFIVSNTFSYDKEGSALTVALCDSRFTSYDVTPTKNSQN
jgi:hypothetical protein